MNGGFVDGLLNVIWCTGCLVFCLLPPCVKWYSQHSQTRHNDRTWMHGDILHVWRVLIYMWPLSIHLFNGFLRRKHGLVKCKTLHVFFFQFNLSCCCQPVSFSTEINWRNHTRCQMSLGALSEWDDPIWRWANSANCNLRATASRQCKETMEYSLQYTWNTRVPDGVMMRRGTQMLHG